MDNRFASSFYLDAPRVYGYRLKPFCLLHSVQLEALESRVLHGGTIRPADLLIAVQVCATHETVTEFRRHKLRRIWQDFDRELCKWDCYFDACTSGPDLFRRPPSGDTGGGLSAPWQQVIATTLQRETGMSYHDAWTLPEGRIMWEYYSLREQMEDESLIISPEHAEMMQTQRDYEADNAELIEEQCAALTTREDQIRDGTWPRDEHGRPVPMNLKTMMPDV